MKHIEQYILSKQEWQALMRLLESIWTSVGLDLKIMQDSANYDEATRKEAELRLRKTMTIPMGIQAWLTFSDTTKFPRDDFKVALSDIADRLMKYGVDIDAQLRNAGYNLDDFVKEGYSVIVVCPEITYVHQSGHTKEKAEYIAQLLTDNLDQTDGPVKALVVLDSEARKYRKSLKP